MNTYLLLSQRAQQKQIDTSSIRPLLNQAPSISPELNYRLYELLSEPAYLDSAYQGILTQAALLNSKNRAAYLSGHIRKTILRAHASHPD